MRRPQSRRSSGRVSRTRHNHKTGIRLPSHNLSRISKRRHHNITQPTPNRSRQLNVSRRTIRRPRRRHSRRRTQRLKRLSVTRRNPTTNLISTHNLMVNIKSKLRPHVTRRHSGTNPIPRIRCSSHNPNIRQVISMIMIRTRHHRHITRRTSIRTPRRLPSNTRRIPQSRRQRHRRRRRSTNPRSTLKRIRHRRSTRQSLSHRSSHKGRSLTTRNNTSTITIRRLLRPTRPIPRRLIITRHILRQVIRSHRRQSRNKGNSRRRRQRRRRPNTIISKLIRRSTLSPTANNAHRSST